MRPAERRMPVPSRSAAGVSHSSSRSTRSEWPHTQRIAIFMLMRLGPSMAYAIASVFVLSMLLLESYPSSASVWWLHMTILPVMREPIYLLLAVPGVGIWSAAVLLMLASIFGIRVALHPQRHQRSGFIHAHIALIATGLTMGRAAVAQAGVFDFTLPQFQRGDWSFCRCPVHRLRPSFLYPCFQLASAAI